MSFRPHTRATRCGTTADRCIHTYLASLHGRRRIDPLELPSCLWVSRAHAIVTVHRHGVTGAPNPSSV